MKKKNLEYEKSCVYCEHSIPLAVDSEVLCAKRGVVGVNHRCRRFVFDPLKIVPRRREPDPAQQSIEPEALE